MKIFLEIMLAPTTAALKWYYMLRDLLAGIAAHWHL
jgi:hypothetical protein